MISDLNPERVAFAGDWHMNTWWANEAIHYAKGHRADVIVHAGDFGYSFTSIFLEKLTSALKETDLTLYFVDGNHEDFDCLMRFPLIEDGTRQVTDRIFHLPRGFRWTWGETTWLGLGGAHSVDRGQRTPGHSWWPQEQIQGIDMIQSMRAGPVDVMVTHDCPAGVSIPGLKESEHLWPSEEIRSADQNREKLLRVVKRVRPKALWHGHYHRRYSLVQTWSPGDPDQFSTRIEGLSCDGEYLDENVVVKTMSEIVGDTQ